MKNAIAIYGGPGAAKSLLAGLASEMASYVETHRYDVEIVEASFFQQGAWEEKTELVVFPGGRDLPYCQTFTKEMTGRLKRYVEQGGSYLGICAGGYFAAGSIEFEKGGPLEIAGERDLRFYPGYARGPAYGSGSFEYASERGARLAKLDFCGQEVDLYFNGGAYFEEIECSSEVEVLARYSDLESTPRAIVLASVGHGRALLTGVHPEVTFKDHKSRERKRREIWCSMMDRLLEKKRCAV